MDCPQDCTRNPDYKNHLDERSLRRMMSIEDVFHKIKEKGYFDGVYLNRALLYTAISSYFMDIDRVKCFHGIERTDEHKIAAFTIKWLVKVRPIQLDASCDNDNIHPRNVFANELFAIFLGLTYLDIDLEGDNSVSSKYVNNLIYTLFFREFNGMVLSSLMYLLQKSVKKESP